MPAPSQPAATAPESATTALYRAALGEVNAARHLPVFVRFDEAGRSGPSWNWAAAFLTLNWLVFRQLWGVALVYVAAVEGLALLVLGLGREGLATPSPVQWGVLGAILLMSCLIPGVWGNAWLHADTRRRMTRAVRDAKTVREACAALAQKAPTRRRLLGLVVINGMLSLAVIVAYWGLSRWVVEQSLSSGAAVPEMSVPAVASPTPVTVQPATARPVELAPARAPITPEPADEPVTAPAIQSSSALTEPVAPEPEPPVAPDAAPAPAAPPSGAQALQGFAINVGLFADAGNADRVLTRLLDAGLPAFIQVVDAPRGQRTRVRVGPFDNRPQADDAAARIRALGLDAVVFRQ